MYGTLISSVTVGAGGASSIDFTSIPQTFTDLVVVISARSTYSGTNDNLDIQFNGSTTNYTDRLLRGNGSAAASTSHSGNGSALLTYDYFENGLWTTSTFSNIIVTIPNYAGTTNKSISADHVSENNGTAAGMSIMAGLWSNTAAITSVKVGYYVAGLAQYSTAYLYGLTKGSGGATVS